MNESDGSDHCCIFIGSKWEDVLDDSVGFELREHMLNRHACSRQIEIEGFAFFGIRLVSLLVAFKWPEQDKILTLCTSVCLIRKRRMAQDGGDFSNLPIPDGLVMDLAMVAG